MKAYFISGMAADSRIFCHIRLPQGYEAVHLEWIKPERNESLASYAMRLAQRIDTNEPFALIGLSFGGMLAAEIAKQYKPAMTILISSIPVSSHLPVYFKVAAKLRLHKVVPVSLLKTAATMKRLFTRETNEDKRLMLQAIRESDSSLIRWSMDAILKWHNDQVPEPCCHIHGSRDEVLPVRYTKPTHTIKKGGHMLVLTDAKMVNEILTGALLQTIT
jgi:pimeloyl-ACP methyl ester carboxylesterase